MKTSALFSRTRRKTAEKKESASAELLVRAGYIRQLASGIYSYLPLAVRVIRNIEAIIRDEMNAIGGQEVIMPVVNPADIWKESARWYQIDAEMGRFTDRSDRDMVLAMTHEEVVADLVRNEVHSYRQLPAMLYHIQTKWRDDPRPRAGLIRVREFTMKDSYSLDVDADGMKDQYNHHYEAYKKIFARCEIPTVAVGSDLGMMGGSAAHEFMYKAEVGEDTIIQCGSCGYAANRQIAKAGFNTGVVDSSDRKMEKVETPDCKTIADLARYLELPMQNLAKAVFLMATVAEGEKSRETFVLVMIRGDFEVNEYKVRSVLGAVALRPAIEEEIRSCGIEPGYGSPIGAHDTTVLIDSSIAAETNMVAGANEAGYHYKQVSIPRDISADIVADISYAEEGNTCVECGSVLAATRAVEVGNIFQLGTRYSDSMNCTYLNQEGEQKPVYMGSYGIGLGRLLACVVEEHHDADGIVWPPFLAPYPVHLVNLSADSTYADDLYGSLLAEGIEVLYEDRDERAGVKFKDADLIGIPLRVTVGDRGLAEGKIEHKTRWEKEKVMIQSDDAVNQIKRVIDGLAAAFKARFPLES